MAVALLVACTDDGATAPTISAVTTTSTTVPERVHDGVLRIGILLPESGAGATIGQPLIDAAIAASEAINAAGGVLGRPVQLRQADEGASASAARESIEQLIDEDVDAVVGPASSTIALAALGELLDAGVLTCSPTATALALDDFPDRELFVRTAPSDSLQARAIAEKAEGTGALRASVVYLDDGYGRPLAEATMDELRRSGITVEKDIGFAAGDESLMDEANEVIESDVGVIVVIADAEHGTRMLAGLGEVSVGVSRRDQPTIIVNDALRRPPAPQQITQLATDVRNRIIGVAPSPFGGPDAPQGAYATNAYDCVNLIALASAQAESDDPEEIAAQIASASDGGVGCQHFAECIDMLGSVPNIDYDGPGAGEVQIGSDGDPVRYRFDTWTFDEHGADRLLATVPVSR